MLNVLNVNDKTMNGVLAKQLGANFNLLRKIFYPNRVMNR